MCISKRFFFNILILFSGLLLCGFIFNKSEMDLDTERNVVYQNYNIDKVFSDFVSDKDSAKEYYDESRIVVLGKVSEISKNYKTVTLSSISGDQEGTIKCSISDRDIIDYVKTISNDDIVKVYGKFSVSLVGGKLSIDVSKIEETMSDLVSDTVYSLLDGNSVNKDSMFARTIVDDKITYYIPEEWAEVEYDIVDNNLGYIEGYQYRLNEIPESVAVQPESFFVCYFDNSLLKNSGDKSKTDLIEKAIIANILDKSPDKLEKFPVKKVDTYYGAKYQYYQDAYKDLLGQGRHVEFVFQQVNNDGIIVYLYVFNEKKHVEDIMFVMRLLEVK